MIFAAINRVFFPYLAKEGWREAPEWFETMTPQVRQERYIAVSRTDDAFLKRIGRFLVLLAIQPDQERH